MILHCFQNQVFWLLIPLFISYVAAITIDDFFPFGTDNGDAQLPDGDDEDEEVQFMPSFLFYGQSYSFFGVSTNGVLSLNTTSSSFIPEVFPTNDPIIAPFWADADTTYNGSVYYSNTSTRITDVFLLNKASNIINTAFTDANFVPQQIYIITWFEVDYFKIESIISEINTFQAVLVANSALSFVLFLYEEGGIHWTTADSADGVNGQGGNPATAGLNAGVMGKHENVTYSNTNEVINIDSTTNIGIPGIWAFQVNEADISAPDPCTSNPCDPNAQCSQIGVSSDFTCTCTSPFTGNGTICIIPQISNSTRDLVIAATTILTSMTTPNIYATLSSTTLSSLYLVSTSISLPTSVVLVSPPVSTKVSLVLAPTTVASNTRIIVPYPTVSAHSTETSSVFPLPTTADVSTSTNSVIMPMSLKNITTTTLFLSSLMSLSVTKLTNIANDITLTLSNSNVFSISTSSISNPSSTVVYPTISVMLSPTFPAESNYNVITHTTVKFSSNLVVIPLTTPLRHSAVYTVSDVSAFSSSTGTSATISVVSVTTESPHFLAPTSFLVNDAYVTASLTLTLKTTLNFSGGNATETFFEMNKWALVSTAAFLGIVFLLLPGALFGYIRIIRNIKASNLKEDV